MRPLKIGETTTYKGVELVLHYDDSESWGNSIFLMETHGRAISRIYWYHDDNTTVYLDMLDVSKKDRKKGIGTTMQEIREKIGIDLGATIFCLWVRKDTWMYDWYKRRGYEDYQPYEKEENAIWMRKQINLPDGKSVHFEVKEGK